MSIYLTAKQSITETINKCKATLQAKKIGATGKWREEIDEEGYHTEILEYEDGTYIEFGEDYGILSYQCNIKGHELTPKNYNIDFIEASRDKILEKYGEEGLEFYIDYTHFKMSYFGVIFNNYRRGVFNKTQLYDNMNWYIQGFETYFNNGFTKGMNGNDIADYLYDNNSRYEEMCRELDLNGLDDFMTIRRANQLYPNDSIDKRIIHDKGYSSSSTEYGSIDMIDDALSINSQKGWLIITNYKNGNPANHGMHLGYGEYMNTGSRDWGEVLNPPNQKMQRLLIDTTNHVIIQEPYETQR